MKKYILLILSTLLFFNFLYGKRTSATILIKNTNKESLINIKQEESEYTNVENFVEILKSRALIEKTLSRLFAYEKSEPLELGHIKLVDPLTINDEEFSKSINKLQKLIKVVRVHNSDIIKISIDSNYPENAALIINTLISECQKLESEWNNNEFKSLQKFINNQLNNVKTELNEAEEEMMEFLKKTIVMAPEEQLKQMQLSRNIEVLQQNYIILKQKEEENNIKMLQKEIGSIRIIDWAY